MNPIDIYERSFGTMSGPFDFQNEISYFELISSIRIKVFTSSYAEFVGDDLVFSASTTFSPLSNHHLVWRKEKETDREFLSVLLKDGSILDIGVRVITEEDDPYNFEVEENEITIELFRGVV